LSYLPKADSIRVVSNRIKNYLVEKLVIAAEKISVRPIFVDVERIKNAPILDGGDLHKKYPRFEKIILMASRLEREKNIPLALHAFALVLQAIEHTTQQGRHWARLLGVPKAGLVIVGSGSQEAKLRALAAQLGLGENVIFESWADSATLVSYYKTADLFLNTSLYEGYGMTLVEAHAAGCAMISTDVGVAREVGAKIVGWTAEEVAGIINDYFPGNTKI
jgi:glycosyltransferase involved in cell wall biosynthesis